MQHIWLPEVFIEIIAFVDDVGTFCNLELAFCNDECINVIHRVIIKHLVSRNSNIFNIDFAKKDLCHKIGFVTGKKFCKVFAICDWSTKEIGKIRNVDIDNIKSEWDYLQLIQKNLVLSDQVCPNYLKYNTINACIDSEMKLKMLKMCKNEFYCKYDMFKLSLQCNKITEKYVRNRNKYCKRQKILMRLRMQSSGVQYRFSFKYFDGISKHFLLFMKKSFDKHFEYYKDALMEQLLLCKIKNDCKKAEFYTMCANYDSGSHVLWQDTLFGNVITIAMIVNSDLNHVCVISYDGRNHISNF